MCNITLKSLQISVSAVALLATLASSLDFKRTVGDMEICFAMTLIFLSWVKCYQSKEYDNVLTKLFFKAILDMKLYWFLWQLLEVSKLSPYSITSPCLHTNCFGWWMIFICDHNHWTYDDVKEIIKPRETIHFIKASPVYKQTLYIVFVTTLHIFFGHGKDLAIFQENIS